MTSTSTPRRALRRAAVPLAAIAVAVGVAAATATPAAANNSYNGRAYIYGAGDPSDDLNDEGVVNESTNRLSNVTCLWQSILYVGGYLPASGIDGSFGPNTYKATRAWQTDNGLASDGSAGKATFKKAGTKFFWNYTEADGGVWIGEYVKGNKVLMVWRDIDKGNWTIGSPTTNAIWSSSYNSRTC
ncbi:peptidoglycan-binding protein [Streptomyces sp. NPDC021020]|uniref:peptidoglycan-binding protein n=1 Tax=Streptomyces sp. NPDC021020 TaxID=3365109 RepID=UPI0037B82CBA